MRHFTGPCLAITLLCSTGLQAAEDAIQVKDRTTDLRYGEEAVQWTPHSVTVITKDELQQTYRQDLEDLESMAPGLIIDRMNTTPRGAAIAIRGLGSSESSKGFEPAVALSVDGVYVGTHTNRMQVLFDFEEVEVVRGPESTYQPAPNLAGSVNITRSKPTGKPEAHLSITGGDHDRRAMDAIINFPVIDSVDGKVAVTWKDRGGDYVRNVFNERNENTEDHWMASASFLWRFRDVFTLQYTVDNENSDETTPAILNISGPTDLLCSISPNQETCRVGVSVPQTGKIEHTVQNTSNDREYNGAYHTLRFESRFLEHDITIISAIRDSDEKINLDADASHVDFYHLFQDQEYSQVSHEFRASRELTDNIDYSIGAYFLNTEYEVFQQEFHILKRLSDAGFSPGHAAGEIQELSSEQKSNLTSAFAHVNYVLGDQWIADLGLRWTQVEKDFEHSPSRIRLGDNVSPLRTLLIGDETSKELLVSAGISYKVDEEAMIFLRYSEGFRPGGFDENAMSAFTANSYGSETSRNAEIGLKSDWADDRLRVNLAYFKTELDNKVERFPTITDTGQIESVLDNVSEVEISGWEIEIEATPIADLYLNTAYVHMNADYNNYFVPDIANPGQFVNNSSLLPARAPDEELYFSARYSFTYGQGLVHTFAEYRLFSDYQTNPLVVPGKVNNWTAWDLSIAYEWREWMFRLFSKNVKDKRYIQNVAQVAQTDVLPVGAGNTGVPGLITSTEYNQPRYTGFEIIYRPNLNF